MTHVVPLFERLLRDTEFRARFRRDPAGTCEAAGLPDLARALRGRAGLLTLEVRESRSALAGAIAAAAAEAVGGLEAIDPPAPAPAHVPPTQGPAAEIYRRGEFPVVPEDQIVRDVWPREPAGATATAAAAAAPPVPTAPPAEPAHATFGGAGTATPRATLGGLDAAASVRSTLGGRGGLAAAEVPADAMPVLPATAGGAAAAQALSQLGTPYVWGGAAPGGFDCSGLLEWAYKQLGVTIPRVAADQAAAGIEVPDPTQLLAGDLVYFRPDFGPVQHIGMYLGDGRFLHAPHAGDVVKISSLADPAYLERYAGARRIVADAGAPAMAPAAASGPAVATLGGAPVAGHSTLGGGTSAATAPTMGGLPVADAAPTLSDLPVLDPTILPFPGDAAPPDVVARWMGTAAAARGLPPELPVIASLVESGLRNLTYGDKDSLGLFQQRPSAGWGTPEELTTPEIALGRFLDRAQAADVDGVYSIRGPDAYGEWIQAVQRSGFPERYQPRLDEARALILPGG